MLETALTRYRWACEELLLDALYQQLNRRSVSNKKMRRFLHRAYNTDSAVDLYGECEDLTLYYFSALRESTLDMMLFLLQYFECDHDTLASMIFSVAGTQAGRRKTLGFEDIETWQPKKKSKQTTTVPGTKRRNMSRYLF